MEDPRQAAGQAVWKDDRAVVLLMAAMLTTMANATISPALPGLERLFARDPDAALLTRLLVTAPSLSVAVLAPVAGLATDRVGRRRPLLIGILLFVTAGCAGLVLPSLQTILASRLVLGIAVALLMTAQTALVADYFSGADPAALMGLQISARNFGGLLFITLAGWTASLSPRLPFAIYGLAIFLLPLAWKIVTDGPRPSSQPKAEISHEPEGSRSWMAFFLAVVLLQALTNMLFFIMPTQLLFFLTSQGQDSAVMTGTALGVLMLSGGCVALLYAASDLPLAMPKCLQQDMGAWRQALLCCLDSLTCRSAWPVPPWSVQAMPSCRPCLWPLRLISRPVRGRDWRAAS